MPAIDQAADIFSLDHLKASEEPTDEYTLDQNIEQIKDKGDFNSALESGVKKFAKLMYRHDSLNGREIEQNVYVADVKPTSGRLSDRFSKEAHSDAAEKAANALGKHLNLANLVERAQHLPEKIEKAFRHQFENNFRKFEEEIRNGLKDKDIEVGAGKLAAEIKEMLESFESQLKGKEPTGKRQDAGDGVLRRQRDTGNEGQKTSPAIKNTPFGS